MLPGAGNYVCKSSVVRGNMGVEGSENQVHDWIEAEFDWIEAEFAHRGTQNPLDHAKSCLF